MSDKDEKLRITRERNYYLARGTRRYYILHNGENNYYPFRSKSNLSFFSISPFFFLHMSYITNKGHIS